MSVVFTESFEGASGGTGLSTTNTAYTTVNGSSVFASGGVAGQCGRLPSDGATKPLCAWNGGTAYAQLFIRRYWRLDFLPTNGGPVLIALSGGPSGTTNGSVVITSAGKFAIRNGGSTSNVAGSSGSVPTNQWMRVEWGISSGNQILRLFYGGNVNGITPDETLTGAFATTGTDTIEDGFKVAPSNVINFDIDEAVIDDSLWVGPLVSSSLQTLTPASDVTTTGWSKVPSSAATFASTLADSDDTTYVQSPASPSGSTFEVALSSGTLPNSRNGHSITVRMASQNATTTSVVVSLRQGASTQIAAWTETGVTSTPTDFTYTVTGTQATAITDYTDLRIRIVPTAS